VDHLDRPDPPRPRAAGALADDARGYRERADKGAAPSAPSRTSGVPSPHAPRRCGAHSGQRAGRASRGQTASAEAVEVAENVRMRVDRVREG
jgi:hypothetical protein